MARLVLKTFLHGPTDTVLLAWFKIFDHSSIPVKLFGADLFLTSTGILHAALTDYNLQGTDRIFKSIFA